MVFYLLYFSFTNFKSKQIHIGFMSEYRLYKYESYTNQYSNHSNNIDICNKMYIFLHISLAIYISMHHVLHFLSNKFLAFFFWRNMYIYTIYNLVYLRIHSDRLMKMFSILFFIKFLYFWYEFYDCKCLYNFFSEWSKIYFNLC